MHYWFVRQVARGVHDACRAAFGCRKAAGSSAPAGRCAAKDLRAWPEASMYMWVTVSGTPGTPRAARTK